MIDSTVQAREIRVRGLPARVFEGGQGPTLLLVHGGYGGAALHWSRVWTQLAGRYRVIAPDLPGIGDADQPALGSVRDYAAWLEELLDVLGVERAFYVGNSFGASVGWTLASRAPTRCLGLVFVNGFPMPRTPAVLQRLGATAFGRAFLRWGVERFVYSPAALRRAFVDAAKIPTVLSRIMTEDWPRIVPRHVCLLIAGDGSPPPGVRLALLWGASDRLAGSTRAAAHRLHKQFVGSTLHLMEGAGHFPQLEAPERFVELLTSIAQTAAE